MVRGGQIRILPDYRHAYAGRAARTRVVLSAAGTRRYNGGTEKTINRENNDEFEDIRRLISAEPGRFGSDAVTG